MNPLLHCFHPILRLCIYTPVCNFIYFHTPTCNRSGSTSEKALGRHWLPLQWVPSSNPFTSKAETTYCREEWAWQIHFSLCSLQRAGRVELQRNLSVTWQPEYLSLETEFGTTLWPLKKKTKNLFTKPHPKPSPPSAWELLACPLEK